VNLGGCVLSAADGVALGAAASTSQTSVQLIVFVAIMLHKVMTPRAGIRKSTIFKILLKYVVVKLPVVAAVELKLVIFFPPVV